MPAFEGVATDGIVNDLSELLSHELTAREDARRWWNSFLRKVVVEAENRRVDFGTRVLRENC
jgi:hypothetical protein